MRIALIALALTFTIPVHAEAKDFVIYLHNAWYEKHKDGKPHKKFGFYDIAAIHAALKVDRDLLSPDRGPDLAPAQAAAMVADLIGKEISKGRRASEIKVIGASKGAYIAMLVSQQVRQGDIRYVLLGGCNPKRMGVHPIQMSGKVLSIIEKSDTVAGPCPAQGDFIKAVKKYDEITLNTGTSHGFLFRADTGWVQPALDW